jgi:hypothetical protein
MRFLQHLRELILRGYVAGLIPRDVARRKANMITREIEKIGQHERAGNGRS